MEEVIPRKLGDEDTPEWTDDQLDRAALAVGGKVVRPANGTLTRAGRPPLGAASKRQVMLRLDPDVIDRFREGGPGGRGGSTRRCGRRWGWHER